MAMEATNTDPLKVKLTSVVSPDGGVSHHVVLDIEGARVVFDGADKIRVIEDAIGYLNRIAAVGRDRLRRLL